MMKKKVRSNKKSNLSQKILLTWNPLYVIPTLHILNALFLFVPYLLEIVNKLKGVCILND